MPYSDKMSFTERWYNTFIAMTDWMVREWIFLPSEEKLAQKYFAHLAPLPPLRDVLYNISMTLVNAHRAVTPPRPSMPSKSNIIWSIYALTSTQFMPMFFQMIRCDFNRWCSYKTYESVAEWSQKIHRWSKKWRHLFQLGFSFAEFTIAEGIDKIVFEYVWENFWP